jgi:hypothetical protein
MEDTKVTLSELVAEIMHVSTTPSGRYFNPPPEARFISNRNKYRAPTASVTPGEQATGPFNIDLDSTTEAPNLSAPPFTFVSSYISPVNYICSLYQLVLYSATAPQCSYSSNGPWRCPQHLWKQATRLEDRAEEPVGMGNPDSHHVVRSPSRHAESPRSGTTLDLTAWSSSIFYSSRYINLISPFLTIVI